MIIAVNFPILSNWKEEAWKKSRLPRDSNLWPPRYRCDALPTELWSHTLGARSIYWVHSPMRSEVMWSIYEIIHIFELRLKIKVKNDHRSKFSNFKQLERRSLKKNQGSNGIQTRDLAPNVWLHSSVGRASHRYRGGHGFESRWSLYFFQASSFQLLKIGKFTAMIILYFDLQPQFKYMNYFIYTSHHYKNFAK